MTNKTLIVGGRSRVARALRRLYPDAYHFVSRSKPPCENHPCQAEAESPFADRTVTTYEDLSADDLRRYSTVVNLLGVAKGTPQQMMAVNGALPSQLASTAASCAGVTA